MEQNAIKLALDFRRAGFSIVVIGKGKKCTHRWKDYQVHRINPVKLELLLRKDNAFGIAVVTGKASQNLEVLDFDLKNANGKLVFEPFLSKVKAASEHLADKLVKARTRSNGYHMIYRCEVIGRNQVLAKRDCTPDELHENPREKAKTLIETRGLKGYAVIYPTPDYQFLDKSLLEVQFISPEERDILFRICREFNTVRSNECKPVPLYKAPIQGKEDTPLYIYNARGNVIALLEKHGWKNKGYRNNTTYLQRPGYTENETSATYNHDLNLFYVFTTSTEFEANRAYMPYQVYAILECDSDFSETAKRLRAEGYFMNNHNY